MHLSQTLLIASDKDRHVRIDIHFDAHALVERIDFDDFDSGKEHLVQIKDSLLKLKLASLQMSSSACEVRRWASTWGCEVSRLQPRDSKPMVGDARRRVETNGAAGAYLDLRYIEDIIHEVHEVLRRHHSVLYILKALRRHRQLECELQHAEYPVQRRPPACTGTSGWIGSLLARHNQWGRMAQLGPHA